MGHVLFDIVSNVAYHPLENKSARVWRPSTCFGLPLPGSQTVTTVCKRALTSVPNGRSEVLKLRLECSLKMSFSDNNNISVSVLGNEVMKKGNRKKELVHLGTRDLATCPGCTQPLTPKAVDDGWMDIKEACFQNKITIIYCTDIFTEQSTLKTEMYLNFTLYPWK